MLTALEASSCTVYLATQTAHGQSVDAVIPKADVDKAKAAVLEELKDLCEGAPLVHVNHPSSADQQAFAGLEFKAVEPVTMVSVVMEDLGATMDVVSRFTKTLSSLDINILISGQGTTPCTPWWCRALWQ